MTKKKIILLSFFAVVSIGVFADVDIQKAAANDQTNSDAIFQALPKYTIKAGSHTAAQNAEHQKYCAQFDSKDITDTIDIQVGYDNVDPMDTTVFCMGDGIPKSGNFAGAVAVNSDSELPLPENSGLSPNSISSQSTDGSSVKAYPINGKVVVGADVFIWGYATWNYTLGGKPMITVKGWINGTDCLTFAASNITRPTGFIRGNTANCGKIYGSGDYVGTTDSAYISGPNGSSSSVPGVIDIIH